MSAQTHVSRLLSRASAPPLPLDAGDAARLNPKWIMLARTFLTMLQAPAVLPRLARAESAQDLKVILFVDTYLGLMRHGRARQHVHELLANADVPLAVIAQYAALSFARETIWRGSPDMAPDDGQLLYSLDAAAVQLGVDLETLYRRIVAGEVRAELFVTPDEMARLLANAPAEVDE